MVTPLVQHHAGVAGGPERPELHVPAAGRQPALVLRPWAAADIPALAAEMSLGYHRGGMWAGPDEPDFRTEGERDAAQWLGSQDRGWHDGDRLCFAVLVADEAGAGSAAHAGSAALTGAAHAGTAHAGTARAGTALAGNVGLKNREEIGRIGERAITEIGYWTALAERGRGIAPAAVRAVTDWVFDAFAGTSLHQIMLVHDVDNPASCRVAEKAGYPFRELSPAKPPHWFTDGHIHLRFAPPGRPG